ncbi:MAG TPA: ferrochelatase, partial [Anaerolineae bacterium]|nr:ferrochelatase [Anaerolineae bacterium]
MAYGSPETLDDVEAYYTHIRGGRSPSPEALAELKERYRRIGGRSPLLGITCAQARALEQALNADESAGRFRVYVGMLHWGPFIHEAVGRMVKGGIREAVGLALVPHYSRISVGA